MGAALQPWDLQFTPQKASGIDFMSRMNCKGSQILNNLSKIDPMVR